MAQTLHHLSEMTKCSRFVFLTLAVATAAMAFGGPVRAAERFRVAGSAGIASPVGILGANVAFSPQSWLVLEAGTGFGYTGWQLSVMPKISLGSERNRFMAGVGVSLAPHFEDDHGHSYSIPWLNVDLAGWEHRFPTNWSLGLSFGTTTALETFHWDALD